MKLTLPRADLVRALQSAVAPVDDKPSMPILACLLLEAHEGVGLTALGSNPGIEISAHSKASVTAGGRICVPGKTLLERAKLLPEGDVQVSVAEQTIALKGGSRSFKVATQPAESYPKIHGRAAGGEPIECIAIEDLLSRGTLAMSEDETRPHISSAVLQSKDGVTEVASAMSAGMAVAAIETGMNFPRILLPRRGVLLLQRFISGGGKVAIEVTDGMLHATREGLTFSARLCAPDVQPQAYREVLSMIEKSKATTCTVERALLLDAVRAISGASEMRQLCLRFAGGKLHLVGSTSGSDLAEDTLTAMHDGEAIFAVAGQLFAAILNAASTQEVSIRVGQENDPVLVREVDGVTPSTWVQMPINMNVYRSRHAA